MKTWPKCFIATELAEWFCNAGHANNTQEAIELGEALVDHLFIVHVNRDHNFKNEMLYFRFMEDEREKGHVRKVTDGSGNVQFKSWNQFLDTPSAGK